MLHKIKREVTRDDSALELQSVYPKLKPDAGFDIEIRSLRHAAQLRQKDSEIEVLRGDLKTANEKLEKAEGKSTTLTNINQGLNKQWKEALENYKEADDLSSQLRQQLGELKESRKHLQAKLDESRSNNQSLKNSHSSQTKLLEKRHKFTQQRTKELEVELKSVKIKYEELEKELYRSEVSIKSLNEDVEKLKKDNTLLSAGLLQDFEETVTQKKMMSEMESDLKRIRAEREELRNQVETLKQNQTENGIKGLKGQVDESNKDLDQVQKDQNRLRIQLEASVQVQKERKTQCEKLQNQLDEAKTKHDGLESELAQKIDCITKILSRAIQDKAELEELKDENGKLHALRKRAAEVEKEYNELVFGCKKRKVDGGMPK